MNDTSFITTSYFGFTQLVGFLRLFNFLTLFLRSPFLFHEATKRLLFGLGLFCMLPVLFNFGIQQHHNHQIELCHFSDGRARTVLGHTHGRMVGREATIPFLTPFCWSIWSIERSVAPLSSPFRDFFLLTFGFFSSFLNTPTFVTYLFYPPVGDNGGRVRSILERIALHRKKNGINVVNDCFCYYWSRSVSFLRVLDNGDGQRWDPLGEQLRVCAITGSLC